jgi:hypothetical protein
MQKTKPVLLITAFIILCAISGFILINKSQSSVFINPNSENSQSVFSINSIIRFTDDFNGANDTSALNARGYLLYFRGTGQQGTSALWFQGEPSYFPAYNGPQDGYLASDFNTVTGQNNIDNWLVLPVSSGGILFDDELFFYSKAEQDNPYADSIRVMYSVSDSVPEGSWRELGRYIRFLGTKGIQSHCTKQYR